MTALAKATVPTDLFGRHYRPGEFLPFYVPRPFMPQINEKDMTRMIASAYRPPMSANDMAVNCTMAVVDPASLHAHQRIDHARAATMSDEVKAKPIVVSGDGYVLDGNHRWWAHVHAGSHAIAVIRLGLDFDDACDWLKQQPYVYEIQPGVTPIRN